MKVKAAYYTGKGSFEVRDVEVAAPGEGEVSVAVAYCGICGTDLHIFRGEMDKRVKPPQVIGHEMSGVVSAVGAGVTDWKVGDRVAVRPLDWCGACPACKAGNSHVCMNLVFMGIDGPGAFQQVWNVKARTLFRVPDALPLREAALIEPLAVACHDVRRSGLKAGETAVVIGGGPIGLLIALVARAAGGKVLVSEPNAFRRGFAEKLGLEAVDPLACDLAALVKERTGGAGADVVFEVSASKAGVATMTALPKVRGKIVCVGINTTPPPVDLHAFFWKELELYGARLYEAEDFERGLEWAGAGKFDLKPFITGVYSLADIQKGFESLTGDTTAMKTMIEINGEK